MVKYADVPEHLKKYFKRNSGGDNSGVRNSHPT